MPPLRDRHGDLPALVNHFIAKFGASSGKTVTGVTGDAMEKLRSYAWPGNVRELENIIERAMILVKGENLEADHFAFSRLGNASASSQGASSQSASSSGRDVQATDAARPLGVRLQDEEKREIIAAVDQSGSNIAGAARILGINRSTLYYRMRKLGLEHLLPNKVGVGSKEGEKETTP